MPRGRRRARPEDAARARARCEHVLVRDVEELSGWRFDVVVFSDVLEHLQNAGFVVASVPNVSARLRGSGAVLDDHSTRGEQLAQGLARVEVEVGRVQNAERLPAGRAEEQLQAHLVMLTLDKSEKSGSSDETLRHCRELGVELLQIA